MHRKAVRPTKTILLALMFGASTLIAPAANIPVVTVSGDSTSCDCSSVELTATATIPGGGTTSGKFSWDQLSGPTGILTFDPDPPESGTSASSHTLEISASGPDVFEMEVEYDPSPAGGPTYLATQELVFVDNDMIAPSSVPSYSGAKFAFDAADPGVCEINCTGSCGVAALDSGLEWELTSLSGGTPVFGSTLSSTPDPAEGSTVTFSLTDLPSDNDEFGSDKMVSMRYPGCGWANQQVAIFFARDAMNNPDGTVPNWYYYWVDGGVVADLSDLSYAGDHPTWHGSFSAPSTLRIYMKAAGTMGGTTRQHQYWNVDDSVDPPTYDPVSGEWTGKLSARPEFTFTSKSGIYNVRSVVLHEKQHKVNYDAINGGGDSDASDGDDCPDSLEGASGGAPYYFSDKYPDTYNWGGYSSVYLDDGDGEMLARMAGEGVSSSDVEPDKDWSDTNGCQW